MTPLLTKRRNNEDITRLRQVLMVGQDNENPFYNQGLTLPFLSFGVTSWTVV